jgi:hypothetical protein
MNWQEVFLLHIGPGALGGATLEDWWRMLVENRFRVDPRHWVRALSITLGSVQNSLIARRERAKFGRRIERAQVQPPVFVLGMWRSGTTHLQNLLSLDKRFAGPNLYQTMFPHTFLLMEDTQARLMDRFTPRKRPLDNVALSVEVPSEDELALLVLTQLSFMMSLVFPRRADHYDRFLTFRRAEGDEVRRWKQALEWFVRKLSLKYGRPLVLKSPGHACRIRLLLEVFPQARFVHIHRHPYRVYRSSQEAVRRLIPYWALQHADAAGVDARIFQINTDFYEAYFEQRALIPPAQFCELAFDDLDRRPIESLRRVYESLGLPDFSVAEPRLQRYVQSLAGYRKNELPELAPAERERIAAAWGRCFDEWGYER